MRPNLIYQKLNRGNWAAVHPHVCGEDALSGVAMAVVRGSPPRAWGRQRSLRLSTSELRFTPTRGENAPHHSYY